MSPARLRLVAPRTLRGRIVAAVVALLTVGFAAVALVTALVVHRVLVDRLDAQLQAAGGRFSASLEHGDGDIDNRDPRQFQTVAGQAAGTLGARVLNGRVTVAAVVGSSNTTDAVSPAARAVLGGLTPQTQPRDLDLPGLGDYRVIVLPGRDGDLQVTGLPLDSVQQTTSKLVLIEIAVFAAALVSVAAASAGLVRLALRPLGRVTTIASAVAAMPLASGTVSLPERAPTGPSASEVDTLAAAFNAMLEQVESALVERQGSEQRLRHFVADASHELRTPVAVVRSHAELALRSGGDALSDDVRHALGRITAQAERMGHLVDDLLLLARLDSGRALARDDVDLTRVVLDAVDDARTTAPDHRWQLHLAEDVLVVTGDETALHQVIANLLANARVHTPPGTRVSAGLQRLGDDRVRLVVEDDGPGIPPAIRARAFDRFVRGDQRWTTSTGSSGLGLPIVAAIVAAHGGTSRLDDTAAGTRVVVELPVHPPEITDGVTGDETTGDETTGDETTGDATGGDHAATAPDPASAPVTRRPGS